MSTRISSAVLLLCLAACGEGSQNTVAPVADEDRIACAAGGGDLASACTVDRVSTDAGLELVVHNPDGGFHRLLVTRDGRGVISADGAEPARVSVIDPATIEVVIGADRYRLPATVAGK